MGRIEKPDRVDPVGLRVTIRRDRQVGGSCGAVVVSRSGSLRGGRSMRCSTSDPFGLFSMDVHVEGQYSRAIVDYLKGSSATFREWFNKLDSDHSVNLTIRDATAQEMDLGVSSQFDAGSQSIILNPRNMDQSNYDLLKSGETRFIFTGASVMGHEMSHAAGHFGIVNSACGGNHPGSSTCSLRWENRIRGELPASERGGKRLYYDEGNGTRTPAP